MRDAALLREAFAVLGVGHLASAEQVRAAWKRKLKTAHPDVGGTKEAVQHATNMRDVLLAWIKAGRPDLDAQTDPAWGYASALTDAGFPLAGCDTAWPCRAAALSTRQFLAWILDGGWDLGSFLDDWRAVRRPPQGIETDRDAPAAVSAAVYHGQPA